ncbi:hypothetical protein F5Y10DRAFT_270474 [Nemania abortiva]|nr:hypothetical protein F5Y10DRAFT_270474 [Nemania abortiva]
MPPLVLGNPNHPDCSVVNRATTTTISPAICPYGYVSACDITDASRRDTSETVWACCPSLFSCDDGNWSCIKNSGATLTYFVNASDIFGNTVTTTTVDGGINAHSIRVAFHSSDILDLFSSTTDSINRNTNMGSIITSTPPTPTSSVSPTVPSSEALSSGAWIGVGIAVTVGAVILLASIFWLVRRRYANKRQQLSGQPDQHTRFPPEPKVNPAAEIFSILRPSELNGDHGCHELGVNVPNNTPANMQRRVS